MAESHQAETLDQLAHYWAAERPDAPAYRFEGRVTSFAEVRDTMEALARGLQAAGLGAGKRIAWVGKNSDWYFLLLFAAARTGATVVPVGWRLAEPEMKFIIADAEAEAIVATPDYLEIAQKLADSIDAVKHLLVSEDGGDVRSLDDIAESADDGEAPAAPHRSDALVQLYTSGTTGNPKGVVLTHGNFLDLGRDPDIQTPDWDHWTPQESGLLPMPVAHIAGTGYGLIPFNYGCACTITREFDPGEILDLIDRREVTRFFLVPAALQFLLAHPKMADTDTSHVSQVGYGASPIPLDLLRACIKAFPNAGFVQSYGMTETTGAVAILPPEDHDPAGNQRMRSAGKALPGCEIKVVDPDGEEVPLGEIGEVVTRSPKNMAYYWKQPEKTAETVRENGWLHTGDAGIMDEDGYVYIQDRMKDMIITGGENVYPAEVENALYSHPAVADAAVIGVPDEKWGEAVKAIIVRKPGEDLPEDDLIAYAREQIAAFKCPKSVDFIGALPRNASGKILRKDLRAPYWEGKERQVN